MIHKGSCHCGRISFEVDGEMDKVIECNCSHCSRKGYLLWFVPRDKLRIITGENDLATYTFNKHVIKHHFCPTCGCAPRTAIDRGRRNGSSSNGPRAKPSRPTTGCRRCPQSSPSPTSWRS